MRTLMSSTRFPACLLCCLAWLAVLPTAWGQLDAPPESPLPPPPESAFAPPPDPQKSANRYQALIRGHRPSPQFTQDRSFTSTRFWLLDPGNFETQVWFRTRTFADSGMGRAPAEFLLQTEVEIGLVPHLQLDIYENLTFNVGQDGSRGLKQEGNQIEARIAIPSYYGQIWGNPVLYLEWHPRHGAPDRAEFRLLLGGAPTTWLYLAINPYVEANVQSTESYDQVGVDAMGSPTFIKSTKYIADMEAGTTLAAGVRITDWFRVSGELKIGGDMLGDANNKLHLVWFLGPGLILKPLKNNHLKIMATCLFAMPGTDLSAGAQQIEPLVILGSQF